MEIKLLKLQLENFKGIKSFSLEADGKDVEVRGDNATGKTTVADAFYWLLFGKDSQGNTKFNIKTLDTFGADINNLKHSVYAVLSVDGSELHIRKTYYEKWTKKKGSPTASFTGHTTDYEIGSSAELLTPKKLKDFNDTIKSIVPDEEVFKLTTNPLTFNALKMDERKKILMSLVDEVSDEDVIASDSKLKDLVSILGDGTIEDLKTRISRDKKAINETLKAIPNRIDEINHNMPDIKSIKVDELKKSKAATEKEIDKFNEQITMIKHGSEKAELEIELSKLNGDISNFTKNYASDYERKVSDSSKDVISVGRELELDERSHDSMLADLEKHQQTKERMTDRFAAIKEEIIKLQSEDKQFEVQTVCECCGQDIPYHMQEAARQKQKEKYNLEKSQRLEELVKEKDKMKSEAVELKGAMNALETQIEAAKVKIEGARAAYNQLQEKHKQLEAGKPDYRNDKEYLDMLAKQDELNYKIEKVDETNEVKIKEIEDEHLNQLNEAARDIAVQLESVSIYERATNRIKELEAEQARLSERYEELEHQEFLTDEFTKSKVNLMESTINSKFKFTKFKLFDIQINGGVNDICEAMFEGVPFNGGLNNARRINVGLDIINTLSNHYDFYAPIVIDNAESVTETEKTKSQQIRLYVSPGIKELQVDTKNKED